MQCFLESICFELSISLETLTKRTFCHSLDMRLEFTQLKHLSSLKSAQEKTWDILILRSWSSSKYQVCVVAVFSIMWYIVGAWICGGEVIDPSSWTWTEFGNWMVAFPWVPALYTGLFSTGICLWVEVQYFIYTVFIIMYVFRFWTEIYALELSFLVKTWNDFYEMGPFGWWYLNPVHGNWNFTPIC